MGSITKRVPPAAQAEAPEEELPLLENGDHLDQKTFHARYKAMPEDVRAELIGGTVFMPSPQKLQHGRMQVTVIRWLSAYADETPGTEVLDNTTTILGPDSEPQPDVDLRIHTESGGQTRETADGYLEGASELITEVASSTESLDLHGKKSDYERAGVKEYVVIALRKARVFWFVSRGGRFEELAPGPDGILRSEVFPGLWLDPAAILRRDMPRLLEVLRQGLASPEHAAFVAKLRGQVG
jgi:Uma2 family endonuclease